jgi:Flp pilus assembly pilin Flp
LHNYYFGRLRKMCITLQAVRVFLSEEGMLQLIQRALIEEDGQDIAEYAVMLAVILVIVVGTIRLIGSNANTVFSQVASSIG